MVSADNLNLDVLELIFEYLHGSDLPSVALVSRSFLSGVIPRLYCEVIYRLRHAKRYPTVMSPFAAILSHPALAVHVRHVDIQTVPKLKTKGQIHPEFIRECTQTLHLCRNLFSFKCSEDVLPLFLTSLQQKERLRDIHVNANLTSSQSSKLVSLTGLRRITLENASWTVVDMLPNWTSASSPKLLSSLTLFNTQGLHEHVLETALSQLPNLLGLHIIGCSKVDQSAVLRLVEHTPLLESLSMSTWEGGGSLEAPCAPLFHLRNLSLDARLSLPPPAPFAPSAIIASLRASSPPISSFSLRLMDSQTIGNAFIQELLNAHGSTLKNLAFVNGTVATESVRMICHRTTSLEKLELAVPIREFKSFTTALSPSSTLKTLVDLGHSHVIHGPRPALTKDNVRQVMRSVSQLRTVIIGNRIWTGRHEPHKGLQISLDRQKTRSVPLWFMPPD